MVFCISAVSTVMFLFSFLFFFIWILSLYSLGAWPEVCQSCLYFERASSWFYWFFSIFWSLVLPFFFWLIWDFSCFFFFFEEYLNCYEFSLRIAFAVSHRFCTGILSLSSIFYFPLWFYHRPIDFFVACFLVSM